MPTFSPSFTVSQSAITPANVTVTDTSTGDIGTITQRRVFVQNSNGDYLTGNGTVNYTPWPLADVSITLSILTEDIGTDILIQWLDVANAVVTSLDDTFPLAEFNKQFLYYLVQLQGLQPSTYQDSNYSGSLALFWTNIIAGINAVTYGNDIAACQNCFNRATYMRNNQNIFFT